MLLCFNFINDIKARHEEVICLTLKGKACGWFGHVPFGGRWCGAGQPYYLFLPLFIFLLIFPPNLSSLPHSGCKEQKEKRRERERALIRKQNGKENGGETVWNIKRGAYSKMGRGENWEWERERSGVKETRDKRLLGKRRRRKFELRRKAYRQKKGINSQSQE